MPKLRRLSGKQIIAILEGLGFRAARVKGSHYVMQRVTEHSTQSVTVPLHKNKPLATGTLRSILRQASLYVEAKDLNPHFYSDYKPEDEDTRSETEEDSES